MNSLAAQRVISRHRRDAVVVATMSAHYEWPQVTTKPELDLLFSKMSKASSLALGLALGRPDKRVFLFDGDGSLLMNLGTLVTIANMAPTNLLYFLIDNGCYRCCPPGEDCPGSGRTDFGTIAQGAGFTNVYAFQDAESLHKLMPEIVEHSGPIFTWLRCDKEREVPNFPYLDPLGLTRNFIEALRNA